MLENGGSYASDVEHEIFANDAAGIGKAVRKLFVGGEQKQTWSFRAVGTDDDRSRFLQMRVAVFVEVDGAGYSAVVVHFDAMDVGVGADLAAPRLLPHANGGGQRHSLFANPSAAVASQ